MERTRDQTEPAKLCAHSAWEEPRRALGPSAGRTPGGRNHTARQGLRRMPDARGQSAATACASGGRGWRNKTRRHLFEIWEIADQKCGDAGPTRLRIAREF